MSDENRGWRWWIGVVLVPLLAAFIGVGGAIYGPGLVKSFTESAPAATTTATTTNAATTTATDHAAERAAPATGPVSPPASTQPAPAPTATATTTAAPPPAPATPHSSTLSTAQFDLEIMPCSDNGGTAECEVWITPKRSVAWYFSDVTHLVDSNGGAITANWMSIGAEARTVSGWGYRTEFMELQPGIRTRAVYRFPLSVDHSQIQAMVIQIPPPLSHRVVTVNSLSWR